MDEFQNKEEAVKVAKYWVKEELTLQKPLFGRDRMPVWGASNISEEDAKLSAIKRKESLKSYIESGFTKKDEYQYSIGYLREEIIREVATENGDALGIISRNNYGALILNVENVAFGDIDIEQPGLIARLMQLFGRPKKDKEYYLRQIKLFQESNPELSFRVYETSFGLRFVLTNKKYSSDDPFITEVFDKLNVDPLYKRLCKQQKCFRARLSPKPWRIGLKRPARSFPFTTEKDKQIFSQWLEQYNSLSDSYTSVKYMASYGTESAHRDIQKLIEIHDTYALRDSQNLA